MAKSTEKMVMAGVGIEQTAQGLFGSVKTILNQ